MWNFQKPKCKIFEGPHTKKCGEPRVAHPWPNLNLGTQRPLVRWRRRFHLVRDKSSFTPFVRAPRHSYFHPRWRTHRVAASHGQEKGVQWIWQLARVQRPRYRDRPLDEPWTSLRENYVGAPMAGNSVAGADVVISVGVSRSTYHIRST